MPRCDAPAPNQALGYFLEQDIQSSLNSAAELIQQIDTISTGRTESWSGTGNAFNLELSKLGAEIECLWDESTPVCRIGLNELRGAVAGWIQLITARNEAGKVANINPDPQLPLPFDK